MSDDFIILFIGGKWTVEENGISILEENGYGLLLLLRVFTRICPLVTSQMTFLRERLVTQATPSVRFFTRVVYKIIYFLERHIMIPIYNIMY